jgi:hypothetical protein
MMVEVARGGGGQAAVARHTVKGWDGGEPDGGGSGRRFSMEERRAAILPNRLCNPAIATVRVSAWGPDEVPAENEVVIGVEEAAAEDCGGGSGGAEVYDAAVVAAMGSVKAPDTRLVGLVDLRRRYKWLTGWRGEGSRRRQRSDAVLTAGVQTHDVEDFRTEEGENRELTASISN